MTITPTQINSALDAIADEIVRVRQRQAQRHESYSRDHGTLSTIPTRYADVRQAINDLPGGNAWADEVKERLAQFEAEFAALRSTIESEMVALGIST